jgi:hypothetical protein
VSRTNRDGGSSSLEKERQNPNTRPTAFGTKVCGISISVLGSSVTLDNILLTNDQPTAAPVAINDSYTVAEGTTLDVTTF